MTEVVKTGDYLEHLTVAGDRWDLLAWDYYSDASKDNLIIDENRNLYLSTLDPIPALLPPGLSLRIPVIEQSTLDDSQLPPWKRRQKD
ncbi:Phage Tail Protein X [Cohaesibacter sp. ES.047]|uniref:tail protein X n=1 Tax=Cohaesibacter sp. ES.047 TaxID=1798205 RepID=UPI000BB78A74|nr:tail protein X [Cohaesibacter sp. ES.047]SNY91458.1 Phage Tail Protein X [Cohaesibacter sp. ES.047]